MLRARQVKAFQKLLGYRAANFYGIAGTSQNIDYYRKSSFTAVCTIARSFSIDVQYESANPNPEMNGINVPVVVNTEESSIFDKVADELREMPTDSNRLMKMTQVIEKCQSKEDWTSLIKMGAFMLSSPQYFCHHSCLLIAITL